MAILRTVGVEAVRNARTAAGRDVKTRTKVRGGTTRHVPIPVRVITLGKAETEAATESRVERPWLAFVCCPLTMIAVALSGVWVALPVPMIASWWWTPRWRWGCLVAVEEGVFGAQWAFVGSKGLSAFRDQLGTVGLIWIAGPLLLVMAGVWQRSRRGSPRTLFLVRALPQSHPGAIGDDVVS